MRIALSTILVMGLGVMSTSPLSGNILGSHLLKADFVFFAKRTDEGVALTCKEGCAWKSLSWTCPESSTCKWGLDSMGMFSPSSGSSKEGFQILIRAADDGGVLTCEHGCAWKELTWTCEGDPCKAKVDFNGITTRP